MSTVIVTLFVCAVGTPFTEAGIIPARSRRRVGPALLGFMLIALILMTGLVSAIMVERAAQWERNRAMTAVMQTQIVQAQAAAQSAPPPPSNAAQDDSTEGAP